MATTEAPPASNAAYTNELFNRSEFTVADFVKSIAKELPPITPQDLSNKVVVITGANAGIGFETAKALAGMSPKKLILAVRSQEKGQQAATKITEANGYKNVEAWTVDLSSFASVKAFAKKFNESGLPIDLFISNAGIASQNDWATSEDGYELTVQVNHLANALLILSLTPALQKSSSPRVIVVASTNHFWVSRPKQDDPTPLKSIITKPDVVAPGTNREYYPISKLFNILFAQEYARRNSKVWICSACPGYVQSELGTKDTSGTVNAPQMSVGFAPQRRPTYDGAKAITYPALLPNVGKSGLFYAGMEEHRPNSITQGEKGEAFGERLWKETIDIIKPHLVETLGTVDQWITN